MAVGTVSDFQVYQEEFTAGLVEELDQNVDAFNAATNNALTLETQNMQGNYAKTRFFDRVGSGLISRRDDTSTSTVTDSNLSQSEVVAPKVKRKMGPVSDTFDAFDSTGIDAGEFSVALGRETAQAIQQDYLNTALNATVGALTGINNNNRKVTASGTAWSTTTTSSVTTGTTAADDTRGQRGLISLLKPFGDQLNSVQAFVMHSSVFFSIMEDNLEDQNVDQVVGGIVFDGNIGTLSKPILVTDDSALTITGTSPTSYITLGLQDMGVLVTESQGRRMVTDTITGEENLRIRIQGEHAFNVEIKGMAYQTGQGSNPNDSTLSAKGSWSKVYSSDKEIAGAMLQSL